MRPDRSGRAPANPPILLLAIRNSITKVSPMKTELVTTLKRKATDIIASVARSKAPLLITQHGRPAVYLVDVETFEALNQRLAVLEHLGRGERAIEEGRIVSHDRARKRLSRWLK
jgi:prevent-host-death family protein